MKTAVQKYVSNDPFKGIGEGSVILGGLVGGTRPSTYSFSPGLWNRFFEALGLKGKYIAFDLDARENLEPFLKDVLELPAFLALTVTKPYKALSYGLLDALPRRADIAPRSRALGSLNQLICNPINRELIVDRTDGPGFVRALKKRMPLGGKKALFIGSGGTALSICYELVGEGTDLTIVDLNAEDAHKMGAVLGPSGKKFVVNSSWETIADLSASCDLIINGMAGVTPYEADAIMRLPENCLLADIHYSGEKAAFAAAVRAAGRPCVDGLEMRYGQFRFAAEKCGSLLGFAPQTIGKHLDAIEEWFLAQNAVSEKTVSEKT
jgi:shikimate 5-dehydrogenase